MEYTPTLIERRLWSVPIAVLIALYGVLVSGMALEVVLFEIEGDFDQTALSQMHMVGAALLLLSLFIWGWAANKQKRRVVVFFVAALTVAALGVATVGVNMLDTWISAAA